MFWTPILQANVVDRLLGAHERISLDFKETYNLIDLARDDTRFELAKDCAAFANNVGGTVLVGVVEDRRTMRIARFSSVQDPTRIVAAIDDALRLCLPIPLADGIAVELEPADQHRILGRTDGNQNVSLVAINVPPFLNGPVGVKVRDGLRRGQTIEGAYRFPCRVVEQTRYLRPEELAMITNSDERRVALRLGQLEEDTAVTVWGRAPDTVASGRPNGYACFFQRVDYGDWSLRLKSEVEPDLPVAVVPLVFVRAIWKTENAWHIAIDGDVFRLDAHGRTGFQPPMPEYRMR